MAERPDLKFYQAAAVALDSWACGYEKGRSKKDAVYQMVVEGRDVPAMYTRYSSCADRAHWRLWRLGCRLPFVNREGRTPLPNEWRVGMNIALLHDPSRGSPVLCRVVGDKRLPAPPGSDWIPSPGDEMITWPSSNPGAAHSLSLLSWDGVTARTANYGAGGMSASPIPGARISSAPLSFEDGIWRYGKTALPIQRVIRLQDMIPTFTARADLEGPNMEVDPGYTGEVRDLIEGYVPGP